MFLSHIDISPSLSLSPDSLLPLLSKINKNTSSGED